MATVRKLEPSKFDRTTRGSIAAQPSRRASRPATGPVAVARVEGDAPLIQGALTDKNLANTLLLLVGSAGCGLIGLFLLLQRDHVDVGQRLLTKVGGGMSGLAAVVFYGALLKLILGPTAVADLLDENKKKPLHVLAGVVVSFTAFMVVVAGGIVSLLS